MAPWSPGDLSMFVLRCWNISQRIGSKEPEFITALTTHFPEASDSCESMPLKIAETTEFSELEHAPAWNTQSKPEDVLTE